MKKSILNLGKILNKKEQKTINGSRFGEPEQNPCLVNCRYPDDFFLSDLAGTTYCCVYR